MDLNAGILLIFGIGVFGGIVSAVIVKRLSIPQVLGYIIAGILIGESGLQFVTQTDIEKLRAFNYFALGIIGFLVGSEIKFATLKKYGKQFSAILLYEGVFAFLLVGSAVTLIMFYVTESFPISLAVGIVFGAISSATDPASTLSVLWEYRTAGILTTTLIAIVALDDALAMTLYGLGTSVAQILTGGSVEFGPILLKIGLELFGSVALGVAAGYLLNFLLHRLLNQDQILATALSLLLLNIWLAVAFEMDIILVTMAMGITIVNTAPRRSQHLLNLIRNLSTPLYVLFFVLVGARLSINNMPGWLWLIVIFYVLGRSFGKVAGAWFGAKISHAAPVIRKYTGMGLFAQGGVAIGLSIMATQHLQNIEISDGLFLGDVIIFGITATTFIVQVAGPPLVKLAARLAGEIGKNITEEDVISSWKVADVLNTDLNPIREASSLGEVFQKVSQTDSSCLPVVDAKKSVTGSITFNELRDVMLEPECWDWLLASDVATPLTDFVYKDQPLEHAMLLMNQTGMDQIPVISDPEKREYLGKIDLKKVKQSVKQHLIASQQEVH